MATNFQGIQFSWKAHLQRFCDLSFADGHSRVTPLTIPLGSASYCMRTAAQILLESAEKVVKNEQAINQLYLYLAEIEKWHDSCIL